MTHLSWAARLVPISFVVMALVARPTGGQGTVDPVAFAREFRSGWDVMMRDPHRTPLKPAELARFRGISWFPVRTAYRVNARFARARGKQTFAIQTSSGGTDVYTRAGVLTFTLNGRECRLSAFKAAKASDVSSLFIPFTDATSGHESYGGGRYLEAFPGKGTTVTLDFNIAYNPYCAYTTGFSCPIPPRENHLAVAVKAGAKAYLTTSHLNTSHLNTSH